MESTLFSLRIGQKLRIFISTYHESGCKKMAISYLIEKKSLTLICFQKKELSYLYHLSHKYVHIYTVQIHTLSDTLRFYVLQIYEVNISVHILFS